MKPLLLALLLAPCSLLHAELKEIRITGTLETLQGENLPGLALPAPYVFTMEFDTAALDTDPAPDRGEYETGGARLTLDLPAYHFETLNTEVVTWSGFQGPNWGFTSGNEDAFTQNGWVFGDYTIYLQINGFFPSIAPTDSLEYVRTLPLDDLSAARFYLADAAFIAGAPDGRRLLDNDVQSFEVTTVIAPEPDAWVLIGAGFILFACTLRPPRPRMW